MIAGDVLQFPDLIAVFGGFGVHLKHSEGQLTGVYIQSRSDAPVEVLTIQQMSRYPIRPFTLPGCMIHDSCPWYYQVYHCSVLCPGSQWRDTRCGVICCPR